MQVVIDGCKREYEVDALMEIARMKKMPCMNRDKDLPSFMKYTKDIQTTKNGKARDYDDVKKDRDKIENRIDKELICPMSWLQNCLEDIKQINRKGCLDTSTFFIKMEGRTNSEQISKIIKIVQNLDGFTRAYNSSGFCEEEELLNKVNETMCELLSMKNISLKVFNRIIETSLGIKSNIKDTKSVIFKDNVKYTRKLLNLLYKTNKDRFLSNFTDI